MVDRKKSSFGAAAGGSRPAYNRKQVGGFRTETRTQTKDAWCVRHPWSRLSLEQRFVFWDVRMRGFVWREQVDSLLLFGRFRNGTGCLRHMRLFRTRPRRPVDFLPPVRAGIFFLSRK